MQGAAVSILHAIPAMLSCEFAATRKFAARHTLFSQVTFGLCESRILQIDEPQNYSINKRIS